MSLGKRIKDARSAIRPKLTQGAIGQALGVTDKAVSAWERDLDTPTPDKFCVFQGTREDGTVEAMMKYLDRSPDASETLYYVRTGRGARRVRKFTVKKADWQKCHVAVGKESGR